MSGFIPQITTRVSVIPHLEKLDEAVEIIDGSEILSECFDEIREHLLDVRSELDEVKDPTAEALAQLLSSTQGEIIGMKHDFTGMMKNSVDVMKDGDGEYLVGNTATSVDGFPYPLAIETGRREVRPVEAKVLRWWTEPNFSGDIVFAKRSGSVNADPYVDYSVELAMGFVEDTLDEYIAPILR